MEYFRPEPYSCNNAIKIYQKNQENSVNLAFDISLHISLEIIINEESVPPDPSPVRSPLRRP